MKLLEKFSEEEFNKSFIEFSDLDLNFQNFVWSQDRKKKNTYYILSTSSKGVAILLTTWNAVPRGFSVIKYSDLHYYSRKGNLFTEELLLVSKDGSTLRTDLNLKLIGYEKQNENFNKFIKVLEDNGVIRGYRF